MPFTGSHPAAVLPLMRWGLMPSALVIGSMVPDLPYFLPVPDLGNTHSLIGLQDHKMGGVVERLGHLKINGYNPRPTALPLGTGPGSAAFVPK